MQLNSLPKLSQKPKPNAQAADELLDDLFADAASAWQSLVTTKTPHDKQRLFLGSTAKRIVIKAGRRGGKTAGMAIKAIDAFKQGRRVLYAAPTSEQLDAFWTDIKIALQPAVDAGYLYKNETEHLIERPATKNRIRAKTAWNADTLRGDYADLLILDEWQLMDETAWTEVGAPMLLDNDGDAVFIFTPPSTRSRSTSKARDKRHALKLFERASNDTSGRYAAFHFRSHDNPHLSEAALAEIAADMTALAYRQEIEAEDANEAPGALWKRETVESHRVTRLPELVRVVVAIDPAVTANETSDETGIIIGGVGKDGHGYILDDLSLSASPAAWAKQAIRGYDKYKADRIVAETNNGGDMVENTIRTVRDEHDKPIGQNVSFKQVHASRGKATRAEPAAALYEHGRVHHVGIFDELEDQMCQWTPGDKSPDRMDALVWLLTELMISNKVPDWDYTLA